MCNLGVVLYLMDLPIEAFKCWWKALQISPTNWDVLVGTFLSQPSFVEFVEG